MAASPGRRTFLKRASLLLGTIGMVPLAARAAKNEEVAAVRLTRETIHLWPDDSPNNHLHDTHGRPRLDLFIPEGKSTRSRAAIVVCPGGGYFNLAPHEGQPFAELFAANGIVAAVLTYHIHPHRHPLAFADAARAVRLMRKHAGSLNIDPEKIGLMGFSAGGHLASTLATQPDLHRDPHDDLVDQIPARPNRLILGYPVISFQKEYGHLGSAGGLLGADPDPALLDQLSNELHVTSENPPAFLFHTADDPVVLLANSLKFAAAYHELNLPVALHVYPHGPHGVGLARDYPELRGWTALLLDWLDDWRDAPAPSDAGIANKAVPGS